MGLFSKKECSICGGEIGLLGNRKLADGNCCKNCAALLSPYLADRRGSTVEEIKAHLAYRVANEHALEGFHPTKIYGNGTKIYLDQNTGMFIVTRFSDWQRRNPDLISINQVIDVHTDVRETRTEEYHPGKDGKNVPFNPPRYRYSYSFYTTLSIDSPWFNEITFELSGENPHSRHEPLFREYSDQAEELRSVLTNRAPEAQLTAQSILQAVAQKLTQTAAQPAQEGWKCACGTVNTGKFCTGCGAAKPEEKADDSSWECACGTVNTGKFCTNCGAKKPEAVTFRCSKCGWVPEDPANPPKFCPNCGDPFNEADRA